MALAFSASAAWCDEPLWELGLGATSLSLPHYRGSDQRHTWLLPLPYGTYRGDILRADRDGARAMLFEDGRLELEMSLSASPPTRSEDNLARAGMPDLAATLELGPKLNVALTRGATWRLDLRLPVRAAITFPGAPRLVGWTATPNLNLDTQWAGWDLGFMTGPIWSSREFNGYYYDVPAAYASATRPAYRAAAGAAGWQAMLGASRREGPLWLGVFARADSLAGASFVNSPLVRQHANGSVGAALAWVFATSSQRVPDER